MPVFVCSDAGSVSASPVYGFVPDAVEVSFDAARDALLREPNAKMVLEIQSPESALVSRLRKGEAAVAALKAVKASLAAILELHRPFRRRVLLVDNGQAQRRPQTLSAVLESWLSGAPLPKIENASDCVAGIDAVAWIIALTVINTDTDTARLAEEVRASILPLELDEMSMARLAERAADLVREAAGKPTEFAGSVSLAFQDSDLDANRRLVADLQAALDLCQGELIRLYRQTGSGSADAGRRLSGVELERDALRADLAALEVEVGRLRRDNGLLTDAITEIRNSNSWKFTAPLRSLRGSPNKARDDRTG